MANKIKNEIELLFKTKLDEKSKQEIGKNLKDLLGNATISFNEAETRKNVQPIIQMLKKLFDKAEISFDADELFNMPSDKALQKLAQISADKFQTAFDRALAKSGGVKIDFGDIDLSSMTEPLKEIAEELSEINQKIANDTKKSVDDIELTIKRLNKIKPKKINTKVTVDGVDQKVVKEVSKVEETIGKIEKTLDASNNPKALTTEKGAINALKKARNEYVKSFENGDPWEIQYQHMISFVSKYEAMTKKIKPIIDTKNPEFAQLYELLSPKAGAAKISLEHFVDVARGNELSEYKNQPWARESTLKKIEQTLKNGISVKDGGNDDKDKEPPKTPPKPAPSSNPEDDNGNKNNKPNTKVPTKTEVTSDGKSKGLGAQDSNTQQPKADTSAFNQKLFEAIEKLSGDIGTAFKSMINGDIDEDQLDDQLAELIGNFLKQFKFKGKQQIEDYLMLKSDNMGEWNSKKIYEKISKRLSPDDPSWPTVENVAIATEAVEQAEKELKAKEASVDAREKELGLIQAMKKYQDSFENTDRKNETAAFVNTKTGDMSDMIVGGRHGVPLPAGTSKQMSQRGYDMEIHPHSWETAAPSVEDFEKWFSQLEYIKKFGIRAGEELLAFDFSKLDPTKLEEIIQKYKDLDAKISAEVSSMPLDEKLDKFGSYQGIQENIQVMLRQGLEEIMQGLSGVMKSVSMPKLPVVNDYVKPVQINKDSSAKSLDDVYESANEEIKELIKNYVILDQKGNELTDNEYDRFNKIGDELEKVAPEIFFAPASQLKSFGERLINEAESIKAEEGAHKNNTVAIKEEVKAQEELNAEKEKGAQVNIKDDVTATQNPVSTVESTKVGVVNDSIQTEGLKNLLSAITYNVKVVQDSTPGEDNKTSISIDAEELKKVLNAITYKVKIAHSDTDKTANKIALDDSTLEFTLTKVFANILNPQVEQDNTEQKQPSWALESTLQTVKGALDQIQTNTSKFGTIKISNVDAIAGTALESKLTEIKSVLESIDNKITKGGVIATRGAVKQANSQPVESEIKAQTARSNMMKSIINDYESMGKLAAQFAEDGDLRTKAQLENLKEEIKRKRTSLKVTMEENAKLREKYSMAFDAEKRLLDAAKAQKEIDKQTKADTKKTEAAWKKQVKDAQRATGINAATSTANAGDQTVLRAIGAEGVSKDIENKAKELSEQIEALRVLRNKIDKAGSEASEKDRDKLSKQISKVKELKTEVDGYLKIHEKYSGEGVTHFNNVDTSNFGAVGTDQYWNNITAAIRNASTGRVTIKGMNTDTGELTGTTKIAANTFAEWSATVDPVTGKLSMLRTGIKKTETLIETISRKTKEIFTYFSGSSIIFKAVNEVRKGVQYIRDIDIALTELKKVTDETEETYDKFLETAAKTAGKVGSTIKDVVSSTADWARLGYSMEQAAKFAETTQILMNVSEFTDVSQATDTLISAVQAFGYTAETSMDVVDLLNTIGNNYAISTADLAQSLTKSSASLVAAGGDLAEAAALTATANKIVQDADSVGTALKTTSLRLRGTDVKVLEEEGLDSEGAVTSKSKLQSKVKALSGVDILTVTGEYKSTYEILSQIADVWEKIDDMDQAALLELISGKRNSSVIAAILQNPEELKAAFEDANNASGSAIKENEKYLDSIQGKIDQFNNSVQALWSDTIDSDVVKFFIDLATQLVKIVDAVGPLNIALIGLFAYLGKQQGVFDDIFNPVKAGLEELRSQLAKAEQDLTKAEANDLRKGTDKTAEKRRNAEERVNILRQKVQEASEEAVLDGIDESFDPDKVKKQLAGKKGARTKRINQLQAEGKTFDEIQADPKVQQYTKDIEEAKEALNEYIAARTASNIATGTGAAVDEAAAVATDLSTASTLREFVALAVSTKAKWADVKAAGQQIILDKLRNSWLVKNAIAQGVLTAETAASAPITTLLSASVKGLAASFGALWTALWPVLLIMAAVAVAVGAVVLLVKGLDAMIKTSVELREELSNLKSEISDVQSEIESLNDELETTQERMAELLAKDSLTFTEQEELENLQKQNDELEREIYLLEQREKRLQADAQKTFDKLMRRDLLEDELAIYGVEDSFLDESIRRYGKAQEEYEKAKQKLVEAERSGNEKEIKRAEKEVEKAEKKVEKWQSKANKNLSPYLEAAEGIDYESADEETKRYLDYIYGAEGKLNVLSGEDQAKSVEIKRIFNKDNISDARDEIDSLVKKLAENPEDKNIIAQISEQCKLAEKDLNAVGLSVQDAADYFAKLGSSASFDTIDGKIAEVGRAATEFEALLNGKKFNIDGTDIGLADLFNKEGKIIQTTLSQVFQNTSDQTRQDITKLLEGSYEQIKSGTVDVEKLLAGFGLKATQQVLGIQNKLLGEQNIEFFPNLKDEIDGIIDKFDEFSKTVGSVVDAMDTLEQARAEEAYSGSVSIETLENLMKYTDDYAQLIEVDETGAIKLATDAEEILINQRIEKIKTDAAAAVQTAQTNLEQAKYNQKAVNETGPVQSALTSATDALAGSWAYLGSILRDVSDGNFSGMFERASASYSKVTAGREEKRTQVNVSVEDAEEALANALNQQKIANALTSDNIKSKYDSEEASGGNKTKDEVEDDRFQREMDYWENLIAANQAKYEQLQNEIDLLEAKGQKADASFYEEQMKLEGQRLGLLESQKAAAEAHLATLTEGSEEWWEVANTLNDIESELDDITASIVDLQDAIGEINTYKFEEFNTRLDNLTSKLETIRNLIAPNGEEDWFDDEGNWTESGVAVLGAHIQELEFDKEGLKKAQEELDKYSLSYGGNEAYYEALGIHSEQEYYDKVEELTDQQYQYLESISDTEQSIVDMYENSIDAVEEYTETLIDGYNDYIDSVKEALEAERALYDFKKNVQKQAKDIAELERRITSLSGSTNKSDIAERRKLEAELYSARESLNDTYYDHAKDSVDDALSTEQEVYEETMNKIITGLRESLEEATRNMDEFLMGVTSMVMYNADTILNKYTETNLPLTKELTNPWEEAKKAVGNYSGNALDLMNQWTKEGGFFAQFNAIGTANLKSPWSAGTTAANSFKSSVSSAMTDVVSSISSNVKTASGELSKLYQQIIETEAKAASVTITGNSGGSGGGGGGGGGSTSSQAVKTLQMILEQVYNKQVPVNGIWDTQTSNALKAVQKTIGVSQTGEYDYNTERALESNIKNRATQSRKNGYSADADWYLKYYNMVPAHFHAKGTTGTTRDEWVVTDESWIGEEITLAAGKNGQLQYLKKGSAVMPADISANLVEWGKINPSMFNTGLSPNVNMITNAINKPELNISFESLIKAENITEETLPAVKKLVTQELNRFTRELNYSLKAKGAR